MDLRWKMVTCRDCGKRYRCTPDTDYYHMAGTLRSERNDTNGRCWDCHMTANKMPPQPEPKLGEPKFL